MRASYGAGRSAIPMKETLDIRAAPADTPESANDTADTPGTAGDKADAPDAAGDKADAPDGPGDQADANDPAEAADAADSN
jgi:hypothetical protein